MIDKQPDIWERILAIFFKILLPAVVGVSVKIAIKMQKEKISVLNAFLSYIIGIGTAWLASPFISGTVSRDYVPMVIAVVAITADKVGEYLIYKWNVDIFLSAILDALRDIILQFLKAKKS